MAPTRFSTFDVLDGGGGGGREGDGVGEAAGVLVVAIAAVKRDKVTPARTT